MSLLNRIRTFAHRHALWRPDTRVIVALSGGSDSVALLLVLRDFASAGELALDTVAHLHHGIRGADADEDEAFCRDLCAGLNTPFVSARTDVPAAARTDGTSIEVSARRARLRFLEDIRVRCGADVIATAHTEDDQAETVLLRLVRGAGGRGLAGIAPRRDRLIRPLLTCTRDDLRSELRARGQTWREDSTNADLANPRNRVRHELLPYLATHFNPSVTRALARFAELARGDESWLTEIVDGLSRDVIRHEGNALRVDAAVLCGFPDGLARRVARHALEIANPGRSYGVEEIELVLAVAAGGRAAAEISGLRVELVGNSAVLIKRAPPARLRRRGARSESSHGPPAGA